MHISVQYLSSHSLCFLISCMVGCSIAHCFLELFLIQLWLSALSIVHHLTLHFMLTSGFLFSRFMVSGLQGPQRFPPYYIHPPLPRILEIMHHCLPPLPPPLASWSPAYPPNPAKRIWLLITSVPSEVCHSELILSDIPNCRLWIGDGHSSCSLGLSSEADR